jgi:hypothetical protein
MATILHAYLEEDGSGLIEHEGKFYRLEYPYKDKSVVACTIEHIERLIDRVGYRPSGAEFDSVVDVINFLRAKANTFAETHRIEISEDQYLSQFNAQPIEMLSAIVDELEDQYLEKGELEPSIRASNRLLSLSKVRTDDRLRRRLERLKARMENERARLGVPDETSEGNHIFIFGTYPKAEHRYGTVSLGLLVARTDAVRLQPAR